MAFVLGLMAAASACGPEGEFSSEPVSIDTVGTVVHVVNRDAGRWALEGGGWTLGRERAALGASDGSAEEVFGSIAGVAVAPDGLVWVADGQSMEVRAFDPSGAHRLTLGRPGEGPGEFAAIDGVRVGPSGRVHVRDPRLGRLSVFAPDGAFVTSFPLVRPYMQFGQSYTLWVDDEGVVRDLVALPQRFGEGRPAIVSFTPDGSVRDTVFGQLARPERMLMLRNRQPVMSMPMPFAAQGHVAVTPSGTVLSGHGALYAIAELRANGDTVRVAGRSLEPVRVGRDARSLVDSLEGVMRANGRPGDEIQVGELPEYQPFFSKLLVDREGYWWVGRGPGRNFGGVYDVFEPDGRYLGEVRVDDLVIHEIGADYVAGVRRDARGVERAVVFELVRSGEP